MRFRTEGYLKRNLQLEVQKRFLLQFNLENYETVLWAEIMLIHLTTSALKK